MDVTFSVQAARFGASLADSFKGMTCGIISVSCDVTGVEMSESMRMSDLLAFQIHHSVSSDSGGSDPAVILQSQGVSAVRKCKGIVLTVRMQPYTTYPSKQRSSRWGGA